MLRTMLLLSGLACGVALGGPSKVGSPGHSKPRQHDAPPLARSGPGVPAPAASMVGRFLGLEPGDRLGVAVGASLDGFVAGAPNASDLESLEGAIASFRERSLPQSTFWERDLVYDRIDGRYFHSSDALPSQPGSRLGEAIDVDGDLAVVGMRGYDTLTDEPPWHFNDGSAVLIERRTNAWRIASEILLTGTDGILIDSRLASDLDLVGIDLNTSGWQFGHDVSIDGDLLAISAPYAAVPPSPGAADEPEAGLVLIFLKKGSSWEYEAVITRNMAGENVDALDYFGFSIALAGDLLVVGAPNVGGIGSKQGSAYVFERTGFGSWAHLETLAPDSNFHYPCGRFGWSVDMSGATIVVGQPGTTAGGPCPLWDPGAALAYFEGAGQAWAFEQNQSDADPNLWSEVSQIVPAGGVLAAGDQYGWSVAIDPCHIAVGAPGHDWNQANPGTTYMWTHNALGSWDLELFYESPLGKPSDGWGHSVSLTATHLFIGGWLADDPLLGTTDDRGGVEVWTITCDCDGDGTSDIDQIAANPDLDCNNNGHLDTCELIWDPSIDKGGATAAPDGILDECQINPPGSVYWDPALSPPGNGHRYLTNSTTSPISFTDARLAANAMGAGVQMAALSSYHEALFIANAVTWDFATGNLWLGGLQVLNLNRAILADPDEEWSWLNGEAWAWSPWMDPSRPGPDDATGDETALRAIDPALDDVWDWDDAMQDDLEPAWLMEINLDCNQDSQIDVCEIDADPSLDCDGDGRIDFCMIAEGITPDCDLNGVPDFCDIAGAGDQDGDGHQDLDCDGNGIPDLCDLDSGTYDDCNANGIPDLCDILFFGTPDGNSNAIPDECELLTINEILINPLNDLNSDGVTDAGDQYIELVNFTADDIDLGGWQIRNLGLGWYQFPSGTTLGSGCVLLLFNHIDAAHLDDYLPAVSMPADENPLTQSGVLSLLDSDGMEREVVTWNANGVPIGTSLTRCPDLLGDTLVPHSPGTLCDTFDIEDDLSLGRRVDQSLFPGSCSEDLDGDGVPDVIDNCDEANPDQADCNGNGIGDICDISEWVENGGTQADIDCDWNDVLDECEIQDSDCNENGILDICDYANGSLEDCDFNGTPDACDIDQGNVPDCNGNGIPDECDISDGSSIDCNDNGVPDQCDIDDGSSPDNNGNGVPDECEFNPNCDLDGDNIPESQAEGILMIINYWECPGSPDCPVDYIGQGDFDGDGDVDVDDLIGFTTSGCP